MTIGIYAGSFDPITYGHRAIACAAARGFDQLIIAIGTNPRKNALFTLKERKAFIQEEIDDHMYEENTKVVYFEGLLVTYCRLVKVSSGQKVVIVRGLRAVSDFEQEMAIAEINHSIEAHVPTVFLSANASPAFTSSSSVKEMARYAGTEEALKQYVNPTVQKALREKLNPGQATL